MRPSLAMAAVTLAACVMMPVLTRAAAPEWNVDTAASRVGFVAQRSGDPVPGEFTSFDATIRFSREDLDASQVDVKILIGSVDAGAAERNQTITSPSLFHAAKYPRARFKADSFRKAKDGRYVAEGDLTMRGRTHPVDLPFELDISRPDGKPRAVADGAVTVKRLRWGIGKGQWKDTSMVPNEVRIEIRIVATRPAGE